METNAKGQVKQAMLGASTVNNTYNDASGMLTEINHLSPQQTVLNIQYGFNAIRNELKYRKTLGDFNIVEHFNYDDNNRLLIWTNPITGQPSTNQYDEKGRIKENDQIGEIKFDNSAKIYQPTGMTLNPAGVQNYTGDLIQSVVYNENNDPVQINGEKSHIRFGYGLGSMRQRVDIEKPLVINGGGGGSSSLRSTVNVIPEGPVWQTKISKFYNEDGSFEVVPDRTTGQEKHIIYIGGNPYESNIVYLKNFEQSSGSYQFLHKDYLGSILAVTDQTGNRLEQRHYDAWGNLTHLKIGNAPVITDKGVIAEASLLIDRGYTGHEHFMGVGIIHMNGRLYDPLLRRFLNADENIQDPTNTQNYNKYGYVMNNPLMYNDPSGEFLQWIIGAFVGGYLNGVAANGGNWNPVKWDWQRTWSSVLGGAIGGAAISGALGTITSNPGAIKFALPGVISGGLNSAFTGGNFLGGAIGGISYTGNLSGNSITSTDGISAGYRYITSPEEDYSGGGWDDLTKSILLNYVKNNYCPACTNGALQQKAGTMFEKAFNRIMGIDYSSLNYESNYTKIAGKYKGKLRNTVPDGMFDLVIDEYYSIFKVPTPFPKSSTRYPGAQFAEVKAMDGTLYSGSNQGQISSMLYAMSINNGVNQYGGQFIIGTTSDTKISPNIVTQGLLHNIQVVHITAQYRMINKLMEMRLYNGGGSPSTTFIK